MSRKRQTKLSLSVIYTRRYRERLRAGKVRLAIVMDEAALTAMLVDRGLLNPLQADDRSVRNFIGKRISMPDLLRSARDLNRDIDEIHDFASRTWRIFDGVYRDRRDLDFKAAETSQHGVASIPSERLNDHVYALSTYYRLGLPISETLHYDVT